MYKKHEGKSDYELYRHFAGEVESRNVEKRYKMNAEDRRSTPGEVTEDVDRDKQIKVFDNGKFKSIKLSASTPVSDVARQVYDAEQHRLLYKIHEGYFDGMLAGRNLINAVLAETNDLLAEEEDFVTRYNQMGSRTMGESEHFHIHYGNPLLEAIGRLIDKSYDSQDVRRYMMAKHGLERNVFMQGEVVKKLRDEMNKRQATLTNAINAATDPAVKAQLQTDLNTYLTDMADKIRKASAADYSGLTGLTNDPIHFEDEAKKMVKDFEGNHDMNDIKSLWDSVNAATKYTVEKAVNSGLISRSTGDYVQNMFQYYIPLQGFEETTADKVFSYIGSDVKLSDPIETLEGRTSVADDPIATIFKMANDGTFAGNRNWMKQALLNFAINHPTSLLTVTNAWYENIGTDADPRWIPSMPNIPENATAADIQQIVNDHELRMKALEQQGMARKNRKGTDFEYIITAAQENQHAVRVKRGGVEYIVYVNGDPRAAQAINGVIDEHGKNLFMELARKHTQSRSGLLTSANPEFIPSNMSRDFTFAAASTFIKEGPKYHLRFLEEYAKLCSVNVLKMITTPVTHPTGKVVKMVKNTFDPTSFLDIISRYKANKLDPSNETDSYFEEFIRNGGETGFAAVVRLEEYKKKAEKELMALDGKTFVPFLRKVTHKNGSRFDDVRNYNTSPIYWKNNYGGVIIKAFSAVGSGIEHMNRLAEDMTRFATYMASRKSGRSIQRSIKDAKDITLNFNKKGSGAAFASIFQDMFMFFNPSVQAMSNFYRTCTYNAKLNDPKTWGAPARASLVAGSTMALGYYALDIATKVLGSLYSYLFGDDDDDKKYDPEEIEKRYYSLTAYERRNNLCIYTPNGGFLLLPLSPEWRSWYAVGEVFKSKETGQSDNNDITELALQLTDLTPFGLSNYRNGKGEVDWTTIMLNWVTPDAFYIKDVAEIAANRDFLGRKIYSDQKNYQSNSTDKPEWKKESSRTASKFAIEASRVLNNATGGNDIEAGKININPAKAEHLWSGALGGWSSIIRNTGLTISQAVDPDESVDSHNFPIIRRFYRNIGDAEQIRSARNKYYAYKREHDATEYKANEYQKLYDSGNWSDEINKDYDEFIHSNEYARYLMLNDYMLDIKSLYSELNKAEDPIEKKDIQWQLDILMSEVNYLVVESRKHE